jgi:mycofactocin precursor
MLAESTAVTAMETVDGVPGATRPRTVDAVRPRSVDSATHTGPTDRTNGGADTGHGVQEDTLIEKDLLVEDVSIDGMCGVY